MKKIILTVAFGAVAAFQSLYAQSWTPSSLNRTVPNPKFMIYDDPATQVRWAKLSFDDYQKKEGFSDPTYAICEIFSWCFTYTNTVYADRYNITMFDSRINHMYNTEKGVWKAIITYYYADGSHLENAIFPGTAWPATKPCPPDSRAMFSRSKGVGGVEEAVAKELDVYSKSKSIIYTNNDYEFFQVCDLSGRVVMKDKFGSESGSIDGSALPDGLYIFTAMKASGERKSVKVTL